jgi:hypothetical protein
MLLGAMATLAGCSTTTPPAISQVTVIPGSSRPEVIQTKAGDSIAGIAVDEPGLWFSRGYLDKRKAAGISSP